MTRPTDHVRGSTDAVEGLRADYDATPYTSNSFPQSAPGQLAALAHLFGLESPNVSTARVLEIGCAAGGNLIPFAAANPRARAVGIDLSQVQIDQGRARVAALGLDNLDLVTGDIARMELAALGQFDFIVAHGVYSWVPPEVQDVLLASFRALLAPEGVAYVSYNVYPGWKSKEVVRDAMLLASGTSTSPDEKVREARRMADFLDEVAPADSVLASVLAVSREHALGFGDSFLLHDELATFNAPCYFYEMLGRAGGHGLTYLAEAHPETMFPGNFGPKVAEYLNAKCGGVQVLVEQYLDFVLNRMFRETLLVHAERAPQLRHGPDRSRYRALHVAAWVPPVNEPTRLDHSRQEYVVSDATLFTNDPGVKAAMDALSARWPWTLSRQELVDAVHARLESAGFEPSADVADHVDDLMGVLIVQGVARFRLDPVLPECSPARLSLDEPARRMVELTRRQSEPSTFNLWHETVPLTPLDTHLLPLLDGTRDRDALVEALLTSVRADPAQVDDDDDQVLGDDELRAAVTQYVDATPQRLAELKLLRIG
ncbi:MULTISPECIES: methyltransferase regulatory domain-containing protein [unclassified Mycobacterium]|uniref:methyltransferase regulatory domain-containing protein n=1 Tax=unclassified Mycobacterium TaxID=2642494 RepID=UPI0029C94E24|nr:MULTISPECIES: methyltransferase regulatory domain-containing protein [unclassified Mycobacterium]